MKIIIITIFLLIALPANALTLRGTLDVEWHGGAEVCEDEVSDPLQVHAYNASTYILRQSPCIHFEANFLYLIIGSERALLIDTGAIADPELMPVAETVAAILSRLDHPELPLLVVHTHSHSDHRSGAVQFEAMPFAEVAPTDLEGMKNFFDFDDWPDGISYLDLGERALAVLPTPGHHPAHVAFYDTQTGLLFSGDFLLPGRLLIDDITAYQRSALRVIDFLQDKPLTYILGGHIELDNAGRLYRRGSRHHPDERPLQLTREDLLALPEALDNFNGFYARHENYVLSNPIHNLLALAGAVLIVLVLMVWGIRRLVRRRKMRKLQ